MATTSNIRRQILFIDAYDSFAQNIVVLFRDALNADITFTTIDDKKFVDAAAAADTRVFVELLHRWDAVIVGPGPGHPGISKDVGWAVRLWGLGGIEEGGDDVLPVLGICLGFQSLCLGFGATIKRLRQPRHGIIGPIKVKGDSILTESKFDDTYKVTHYHSLTVQVQSDPQCPWAPLPDCPELEAIAWDFSDDVNGPILQAVRHTSKPFWGVQYHPESICSENGILLARNWWKEVTKWRDDAGRSQRVRMQKPVCNGSMPAEIPQTPKSNTFHKIVDFVERSGLATGDGRVTTATLESRRLTTENICKELNLIRGEIIVLESGISADGTLAHAQTGKYSVIGLCDDVSLRIEWACKEQELAFLSRKTGGDIFTLTAQPWSLIKEWVNYSRADGGNIHSPFWGGLMGFVSYEAGLLASLGVNPIHKNGVQGKSDYRRSSTIPSRARPDIAFVHVTRSVVIDHVRGRVYVQSLRGARDTNWIEDTRNSLECLNAQLENPVPNYDASEGESQARSGRHIHTKSPSRICRPQKQRYWESLRTCDGEIRAGNSYELCLTDATQVYTSINGPVHDFAWPLYRDLVNRNTAPFSAFLRLQTAENGVTIISSSPERFLSWDRHGLCEFRPIKGTVKKGPGMTLEKATQILSTSKEIAENLMIADLIRHDLNSVPGIQNVRVPGLFRVEEYATVYQLVSVIQGSLPQVSGTTTNGAQNGCGNHTKIADDGPGNPMKSLGKAAQSTGIDVLQRSLPPGSMTGAPKLRSCQILKDLEQKPRGIYSGVLGYLDCGGGGDFSVIIRTAYGWNDEDQADDDGGVTKTWHVGAGGAVTGQSTVQGEWDEMLAKADTVLSAFE